MRLSPAGALGALADGAGRLHPSRHRRAPGRRRLPLLLRGRPPRHRRPAARPHQRGQRRPQRRRSHRRARRRPALARTGCGACPRRARARAWPRLRATRRRRRRSGAAMAATPATERTSTSTRSGGPAASSTGASPARRSTWEPRSRTTHRQRRRMPMRMPRTSRGSSTRSRRTNRASHPRCWPRHSTPNSSGTGGSRDRTSWRRRTGCCRDIPT